MWSSHFDPFILSLYTVASRQINTQPEKRLLEETGLGDPLFGFQTFICRGVNAVVQLTFQLGAQEPSHRKKNAFQKGYLELHAVAGTTRAFGIQHPLALNCGHFALVFQARLFSGCW